MSSEAISVPNLIKFVESGVAKAYLDGKQIRCIDKYGDSSNFFSNTDSITSYLINKSDAWEIREVIKVPHTLDTAKELVGVSVRSIRSCIYTITHIGQYGVIALDESINEDRRPIHITYKNLMENFKHSKTSEELCVTKTVTKLSN